ncbi:MAG: D-sedoheptulose 7-phosphate isomerase [Desulfarculus sp.]|nr:D-sedoheptulose 7-phosphate isomerase [Desulfarculus sp.]
MLEQATASLKGSIAALEAFEEQGLPLVVQAAQTLAQAFSAGKKLLVFGNGGSAADAQHLAAEMVNRFLMERPSLPALALTTDSSVLTSIGNDYHFDEIFAKQIKGLGLAGDVALGISTSGRSPNVLKGLAAAKAKGLLTMGLGGRECPDMAALCDIMIRVPSDLTPRIQEVHGLVIHILCELVDQILFGHPR